MAYFKYEAESDKDCLLDSFQGLLEEAGLLVSQEFSSDAQVFAESQSDRIDYKTKVKVFISWIDKSMRSCSVEVRSDEPFLRRYTCCENIANQLRALIPPVDASSNSEVNDAS